MARKKSLDGWELEELPAQEMVFRHRERLLPFLGCAMLLDGHHILKRKERRGKDSKERAILTPYSSKLPCPCSLECPHPGQSIQ